MLNKKQHGVLSYFKFDRGKIYSYNNTYKKIQRFTKKIIQTYLILVHQFSIFVYLNLFSCLQLDVGRKIKIKIKNKQL